MAAGTGGAGSAKAAPVSSNDPSYAGILAHGGLGEEAAGLQPVGKEASLPQLPQAEYFSLGGSLG